MDAVVLAAVGHRAAHGILHQHGTKHPRGWYLQRLHQLAAGQLQGLIQGFAVQPFGH